MYEMDKLEDYLKEHGYKYLRFFRTKPGEALQVYDDSEILWNIEYTAQNGNYKDSLLEAFGVLFDGIEDNLTADDVISRLEGINK